MNLDSSRTFQKHFFLRCLVSREAEASKLILQGNRGLGGPNRNSQSFLRPDGVPQYTVRFTIYSSAFLLFKMTSFQKSRFNLLLTRIMSFNKRVWSYNNGLRNIKLPTHLGTAAAATDV